MNKLFAFLVFLLKTGILSYNLCINCQYIAYRFDYAITFTEIVNRSVQVTIAFANTDVKWIAVMKAMYVGQELYRHCL